MIKGVIFDMDGVLVDNRDVHVRSFAAWADQNGVAMPDDFLNSYFGMGNADIFSALMGCELSVQAVAQYGSEKESIYREMYRSEIRPLSGLVDLLEKLTDRGVKIAVGSSAMRKNVEFVLEGCGIGRFFSAIADGDQVRHAKPAPDIFLLAASLMGLQREECFVFEDAFVGIRAARTAGMPVGVLTTTYPSDAHSDYDILINDFTQITVDQILDFGR